MYLVIHNALVTEVNKGPVKIVIYSHTHMDHIGTASMFPRNATYITQHHFREYFV
ncbi:MAG: MBL fold metallo-hydrolase [Nitrosopumilales archaeon]|nr:MBL fold metallo-hydrolase [Nitrosopumilales archaeon]MRN61277.1 MBL fold metallo-hydrolase [Nitrosopumilales archaeon]MRN68982.1 MBL fold metallo-hydrolase [Nitrosopumilales archaeon]